jgi:murein DD-endopeptidase MepM/ murein hydrolase activator NlpD
MIFFRILILIFLLSTPAVAQENPIFDLPLSCNPGTDCWILNYPDVGPDKDGTATDPACLSLTYEDHKGTDFAIADETAMNKGVDVLAAKDGTVLRVRNSEPDRWPTKDDLDKTREARRECGNAVLIDHGDGWQTMYCHMKKGSVVVKPNQKIKTGEKIGQVGLSGLTEFPHLHFGVIHKDKVINPFNGSDLTQPCGASGKPLWNPSLVLPYEPLTFFHLGFDTKPPVLKNIDTERTDRTALRKDASALVFHAILLGVREGDTVEMTLTAPDGKNFAQKTITQEKNRARQMYYIGRKIRETAPLLPGLYVGKITVTRKGADGLQKFENQKTLTVQ